MQVKKFEELRVFQMAYKISLEIHKFSLRLPKIEQYALGEQIQRASKGICANIAEGFGKQSQSKLEFKRFLIIAMGSADEMRVWLRYCYDLGYLDEAIYVEWRNSYEEIAKMLQGLSKSLTY